MIVTCESISKRPLGQCKNSTSGTTMLKHVKIERLTHKKTELNINLSIDPLELPIHNISKQESLKLTEIIKTSENLKNSDSLIDAIKFMQANAEYKWKRVDKPIKLSLKKDKYCDACRNNGDKRKHVLTDINLYLEPKCGHEIHQSCRQRFSRALWDFSGHSNGYQLSDCPVCYLKESQNHGLGYIYYSKTECSLRYIQTPKYYDCPCKYFLDGNKLENFTKKKLNSSAKLK